MCVAMRYLKQEMHKEGRIEGRKEGREEGRVEGRKEGRVETHKEIIRNALGMKLPYKTIHQLTGCSLRKIRAIQRQLA